MIATVSRDWDSVGGLTRTCTKKALFRAKIGIANRSPDAESNVEGSQVRWSGVNDG